MKDVLCEALKREEKESTAITDAYSTNLKPTKLPKITTSTWPDFITRFRREEVFLKTEWGKYTTLRSCLVEKVDLEAAKKS